MTRGAWIWESQPGAGGWQPSRAPRVGPRERGAERIQISRVVEIKKDALRLSARAHMRMSILGLRKMT